VIVSERRADLAIQSAGLVAATGGTLLLVRLAGNRAEPAAVVACAIYGAGLIAMFACSLFNAKASTRHKGFAQLLDHCVIYFLIAATYTPFCLLMVGGTEGTVMLWLVWVLALAGIALRLAHRARRVGILLYVLLGWVALLRIDVVIARLPAMGLALLALGGVIYTLGAPLHRLSRLPYHDALWHGSVATAAGCHFAAIAVWLVA